MLIAQLLMVDYSQSVSTDLKIKNARPELGTLNKRNELASACRHKAPFLDP